MDAGSMGENWKIERLLLQAVLTLGIGLLSLSAHAQSGSEPAQLPFGLSLPDDKEEIAHAVPIGVVTAEDLGRFVITSSDAEHWAESFVREAQARNQIAGAGIAVLSVDGPLVIKGYGFGNTQKRDPVHPDITYLPLGQFGNRFVIEALLDLEKDERVSLHQPANNFLTRISLPPQRRAITVADLFGPETGLTASERGTEVRRSTGYKPRLKELKGLLRRSEKESPDFSIASPLAQAIGSLLLEDISGRKTEEILATIIEGRHKAAPFFNTAKTEEPKFTSHSHTITKYGVAEPQEFLATADGFLASRGIHLTLSDAANILSSDLELLSQGEEQALAIAGILYEGGDAQIAGRQLKLLNHASRNGMSTIDVTLIPDLGIGILAIVNSAPKIPDVTQATGKPLAPPPLSASDLVENFIATLPTEQERSDQRSVSLSGFEGIYRRSALPLVGPDRILEALAPNIRVRIDDTQSLIVDGEGSYKSPLGQNFANQETGRTISFSGAPNSKVMSLAGQTFTQSGSRSLTLLRTVFWTCIVLQFALLASVRWPVASASERSLKMVGAAGVLFMTGALLLPAALALRGHSRTLVDIEFALAVAAFPLASLFAILTFGGAIVAWRRGYWSADGFGFQRRLCFTVGSLGLLGLAYVAMKWNLTTLWFL